MFENTFSRRKGYTPPPVQGELEQLSDHARNDLWNVFHTYIYKANMYEGGIGRGQLAEPLINFLRGVWVRLYKFRIDEYPLDREVVRRIRHDFLQGTWHFPFDIFEAVFAHDARSDYLPDRIMQHPELVAAGITQALERENQAYTFIDAQFVERMTPQEVESIETALEAPIDGVRLHLTSALQKLSDRENPDFRNSIKESISAVEAACKHLTGSQKGDLNDALNHLHGQRPLHPALKKALSTLYGWTSDDSGIRHAIKDVENLERTDARFMLVTCSAFVNYLLAR
jgi:hypothetical protein